jgi:hypothetical protein
MYSLLLKKAIPFALTFILGSLVGGLFRKSQAVFNGRLVLQDEVSDLSLGRAPHGRSGCKHLRGRYLVAESKPLKILFQPDADYKLVSQEPYKYVRVSVTFGADGKVQKVEQLQPLLPDVILKAAEDAARQIQFEPEMVNGLPVTVTREVDIRFGTMFG